MPEVTITKEVRLKVEPSKYFCPYCGQKFVLVNLLKSQVINEYEDEAATRTNESCICAHCRQEFYLKLDPETHDIPYSERDKLKKLFECQEE